MPLYKWLLTANTTTVPLPLNFNLQITARCASDYAVHKASRKACHETSMLCTQCPDGPQCGISTYTHTQANAWQPAQSTGQIYTAVEHNRVHLPGCSAGKLPSWYKPTEPRHQLTCASTQRDVPHGAHPVIHQQRPPNTAKSLCQHSNSALATETTPRNDNPSIPEGYSCATHAHDH
jgi:hypothetical protein